MEPRTRWGLLGGLRFLLAWIVVSSHVAFYASHVDLITYATSFLGQKAAVLGFFLVSGYSFAASLQRNPAHFYRRRLLRIYPLYVVAVVAAFALECATHRSIQMPHGDPVLGGGLLVAMGNLLFLQTYLVHPMAYDGPIWSLAIEMSYYLVAPLLLRLPKWVPLGVVAVSALSYAAPRHDGYGLVYFVFTRLNVLEYAWAWFMGYYLFVNRRIGVVLAFAALGAVLIKWNAYLNPEPYAAQTFLVSLAIIALAAHGTASRVMAPRVASVLNFLGDISYPLYLLQFPIFLAAYRFLGIDVAAGLLALCLIGATGAFYLVDVWLKQSLLRYVAAAHAAPGMGWPCVRISKGAGRASVAMDDLDRAAR